MTLNEFFAIHEFKRERDPENDFAGKLTKGDVDELSEWAANGFT